MDQTEELDNAYQRLKDALRMADATPEDHFRAKMVLLMLGGAVFGKDVKDLEAVVTRWHLSRNARRAQAN